MASTFKQTLLYGQGGTRKFLAGETGAMEEEDLSQASGLCGMVIFVQYGIMVGKTHREKYTTKFPEA